MPCFLVALNSPPIEASTMHAKRATRTEATNNGCFVARFATSSIVYLVPCITAKKTIYDFSEVNCKYSKSVTPKYSLQIIYL